MSVIARPLQHARQSTEAVSHSLHACSFFGAVVFCLCPKPHVSRTDCCSSSGVRLSVSNDTPLVEGGRAYSHAVVAGCSLEQRDCCSTRENSFSNISRCFKAASRWASQRLGLVCVEGQKAKAPGRLDAREGKDLEMHFGGHEILEEPRHCCWWASERPTSFFASETF